MMGSNHQLAQRNERPAHMVRVHGFWMDQTHVTNDQFAQFVQETGYLATAERKPDWETIRVQLPPGIPKPSGSVLVPGAMVFVGTDRPVNINDASQWWQFIPGASWRHPQGPKVISRVRAIILWCKLVMKMLRPMQSGSESVFLPRLSGSLLLVAASIKQPMLGAIS